MPPKKATPNAARNMSPAGTFLLTPAQHREQAQALAASSNPKMRALAPLGYALADAIEKRLTPPGASSQTADPSATITSKSSAKVQPGDASRCLPQRDARVKPAHDCEGAVPRGPLKPL